MKKSEKETLLADIAKLLAELATDIAYLEEASMPVAPNKAIGRISRMDAINNQNINKSLLQSKQEQKLHYEQLLAKLQNTNSITCNRCNESISALRLLRVPQAVICANCVKILRSK
jgi:DnaK suppressor protein